MVWFGLVLAIGLVVVALVLLFMNQEDNRVAREKWEQRQSWGRRNR